MPWRCHPNSEDRQTDTDQHREEGDGMASYMIVKVPTKIGPQRSTEPNSYLKCSHNAPHRVSGEEIASSGGINRPRRTMAKTVEDHKGIEYPWRSGIPYKEKEQYSHEDRTVSQSIPDFPNPHDLRGSRRQSRLANEVDQPIPRLTPPRSGCIPRQPRARPDVPPTC